MKLTEAQKKIVISAGEFELTPSTLAHKLGFKKIEVELELSDSTSEMSELYQIGVESKMFDVYTKMREEALNGKSYAANMMMRIEKKHKLDKLKKELLS